MGVKRFQSMVVSGFALPTWTSFWEDVELFLPWDPRVQWKIGKSLIFNGDTFWSINIAMTRWSIYTIAIGYVDFRISRIESHN
jgi:hypothetical protein